MSLKPIPDEEQLAVGLAVLQHLHDNALDLVDRFPSGTRFSPIGTDGDTLKVLAETPEGVDTVERIARAS